MKSSLPIVIALSLALLTQCNHYSDTASQTKLVSLNYESKAAKKIQGFGAAGIATKLGTYLIGYIFTEAKKEVKKVRDGKFGERGVPLGDTATFPDGYLLVLRVVSDPGNKYPDIATVNDLMSGPASTPGGTLRGQILSKTSGTGKKDTFESEFAGAIKRASSAKAIDPTDKVGFLAICPIVSLTGDSNGGDDIYGIGLAGIYFPLLNGLRFSGEETDLARRVAKSTEVMDLEIYGPNGSGFTTGIAKIPLVWSPPTSKEPAHWITGDELFSSLMSKDEKKQLSLILSPDREKRLKARQAFVAPPRGIRPHLRGDFQVVEAGETTGWILKGLDSAKDEVTKATKPKEEPKKDEKTKKSE